MMKKLYSLLIAMTLAFSVSCFLQEEEDEATPVGSGTVSVTLKYIGDTPTFGTVIAGDGGELGTGENYIYLYSTVGLKSNEPVPVHGNSSNDNTGTTAITINNIVPGSYYLAVCYDYRSASGEPALSKQNPYEFYDGGIGTPYVEDAVKVVIENGKTKSLSIELDDTWILPSRTFLTK